MKQNKLLTKIARLFKTVLITGGAIFFMLVILALTPIPYSIQQWFATGVRSEYCEPAAIVMFGAAGIPGGENMVRLYHVAAVHKRFPYIPIYICLPGEPEDENSTLRKIVRELKMREVPDTLIRFIHKGLNTRSQALELATHENGILLEHCLTVITSPIHMRRCLLSLQKAGFYYLNPLPAVEIPLESEMRFDRTKAGGYHNLSVRLTTQSLTLRYSFWGRLQLLIESSREFTALTYYWLRGWI